MRKRPSSGVIRTPWSGRGVSRGRRLGSRAATACGVRLQGHVGGAMRSDRVAIGEQFPGVFEDNDAVAEQAPTLLRVANYRPGRLAVQSRCFRTGWRVRAHGVPPGHFSRYGPVSRSDSSVADDRLVRYGALLLFSRSSVVVYRLPAFWCCSARLRRVVTGHPARARTLPGCSRRRPGQRRHADAPPVTPPVTRGPGRCRRAGAPHAASAARPPRWSTA